MLFSVPRRTDPRSWHSGNPPQSQALPGKPPTDRKHSSKHHNLLFPHSALSAGGAGQEGLRGQRRLGDLPVLRGPGAGHPDRSPAPAPLLAPVLPTRAERRRVHRPRAARLRQRGPSEQPRPQQVPAPGERATSHPQLSAEPVCKANYN